MKTLNFRPLQCAFGWFFLSCLMTFQAHANESSVTWGPPVPGDLQISLASEDHRNLGLGWETDYGWGWLDGGLEFSEEVPMIRISIGVPKRYEFQSATYLGQPLEPSNGTSKLETAKSYEVTFDLFLPAGDFSDATLVFYDSLLEVDFPVRLTIRQKEAKSEPRFWEHPSCKGKQISLRKKQGEAFFGHIAINCEETEGSHLVSVFPSQDAHWISTKIHSNGQVRTKDGISQFVFSKPADPIHTEETLMTLEVEDHRKKTAQYEIFYSHLEGIKTFHLTLGAGVSYVSYRESNPEARLSQFGMTAKVGIAQNILESPFSVGASGYLTLFPIQHTATIATGVPAVAARFWGINARIGYDLRLSDGFHLNVLPGWYIWGMSIERRTYGIQYLSGPQLFLSASWSGVTQRAFGLYAKFAPVLGASLNLSDRELAFGGSYQLTSTFADLDWFLTLDFSNTEIAESLTSPSVSLYSLSLGIQANF